MMADRWLMNGKLFGDVADAQRLALVGKQIEHAQPGRVGQRFEPLGQRGSLWRCQARPAHRLTTRFRWRQRDKIGGSSLFHIKIIPEDIDDCQYITTKITARSLGLPNKGTYICGYSSSEAIASQTCCTIVWASSSESCS